MAFAHSVKDMDRPALFLGRERKGEECRRCENARTDGNQATAPMVLLEETERSEAIKIPRRSLLRQQSTAPVASDSVHMISSARRWTDTNEVPGKAEQSFLSSS